MDREAKLGLLEKNEVYVSHDIREKEMLPNDLEEVLLGADRFVDSREQALVLEMERQRERVENGLGIEKEYAKRIFEIGGFAGKLSDIRARMAKLASDTKDHLRHLQTERIIRKKSVKTLPQKPICLA